MFSVAIELGAHDAVSHYRPVAVSEALRGYAEEHSLVRADPGKGKVASITGLSARYCPTGRDLYLERLVGVDTPSWERSVVGKILDRVLLELHKIGLNKTEQAFETAIREGRAVNLTELEVEIVAAGKEALRRILLVEWKYEGAEASLRGVSIDDFADRVSGGQGAELLEKTLAATDDLIEHETRLLINHLRRRRRGPLGIGFFMGSSTWMAEARAVLTRLQTEIRLDKRDDESRVFGVSPRILPDFVYSVTLIGDIKAGKYQQFQESVATGYAIFAEHAFKRRFNAAFILAIDLDLEAGKVRSHKVVGITVDDEHRQLWITQRDFALQVLRSGAAPQHPTDTAPCHDCPYRNHCWQDGQPGGVPLTPTPAAKAGG